MPDSEVTHTCSSFLQQIGIFCTSPFHCLQVTHFLCLNCQYQELLGVSTSISLYVTSPRLRVALTLPTARSDFRSSLIETPLAASVHLLLSTLFSSQYYRLHVPKDLSSLFVSEP